ncbi:YdaU family protein [Parahaliea mediterranea]|uniref:YdaU family protein n=1 Tax=Parahaliea mediterranea TaxID=651086 RepID=UPI000E2EA63B|nr:YdaU family protein [Parahaliea mediterranea]
MHHYQHNIGDYAKKTGRLSMLEHGAYRSLMDCIYDRERFPTRDEAVDWVWASTTEEVEAVDFILRRFFELQEDGTYVQKRIAEELENYREKARIQSERGRKGGRPKKNLRVSEKSQRLSNESQTKATAYNRLSEKSLTSNQEPVTSNQAPHTPPLALDAPESPPAETLEDRFVEFWARYPRKQGKESALKAWSKLAPDRALTDTLITDIGKRLGDGAWDDQGPDKQYIPYPATYLNGRGWTDEIIPRGGRTAGTDDQRKRLAI